MTILARSYLVAKEGNPPDQSEDAADLDLERLRFAISDGATVSGFARLWSRLLVEQFVRHARGAPSDWHEWLPAAQQRWLEQLSDIEMPYYGERQFLRGSYATFLGVVLTPVDGSLIRWQAEAVGDSCLFHTRDDQSCVPFPLARPDEFDMFPKLVGSRSDLGDIVEHRTRSAHGQASVRDRIWLMSDALAQWCLAELEQQRPPWNELAEFLSPSATHEQFAAWVDQLRATRGLHDDDVTLVAVEVLQ